MDVVARAMAFVEVLVTPEVQEIEFVDQAVALEQIESAINSDTMNAGIDFLRAFEDGAGIEMAFGIIHYFKQNFSLAREAYAALFEGRLETSRALVRVDAFAGRDSMCGGRGHGAKYSLAELSRQKKNLQRLNRADFTAFLSWLKPRPTNSETAELCSDHAVWFRFDLARTKIKSTQTEVCATKVCAT